MRRFKSIFNSSKVKKLVRGHIKGIKIIVRGDWMIVDGDIELEIEAINFVRQREALYIKPSILELYYDEYENE